MDTGAIRRERMRIGSDAMGCPTQHDMNKIRDWESRFFYEVDGETYHPYAGCCVCKKEVNY